MSDSDDGTTSSTWSYDIDESDLDDSGLDDLAYGWDDALGGDCSDSTTAPLDTQEQSPYEWLLEQEKRDAVAAAAGILESGFKKRMAGGFYTHAPRPRKRCRTDNAFEKTVAIRGLDGEIFPVTPSRTLPTRRHHLSFLLLVERARSDPDSFPGARFLSFLNDYIVKSIIWSADGMMDKRHKIVGLARGASDVMYLERRDITDGDASAAFTYTSSTPPLVSKVYLNNNRFGAAGARSFSAALSREWGPEGLSRRWHVKHLSLNSTPIGAEGAVAVLSALFTGWWGERAVIEMADIGLCGERDGVTVARSIEANAGRLCVKGLNLSHNAIGAGGLRAIANAARHVSGLNYMKLCCCGTTPGECGEISRLISETTTVYAPVMDHGDQRTCDTALDQTQIRKGVAIYHPSLNGRASYEEMGKLDDAPWELKVDANASFADVFMTIVACTQVRNRTSYIAPAGSRLEFVVGGDVGREPNKTLTGSARDYSDSGTPALSWAKVFGALKLGQFCTLRLSVVPAGEVTRRAAIVYALEKAYESIDFPKDIVMKIFEQSSERTIAAWYPLRK
jgi:hypothetical protein